jgi:hypothetical protein
MLLFPQVLQREHFVHADYAYVHQELKRKGGDAAAAVGRVPRRPRGAGVSVQRMLEYLGCVPEVLTPDNLKSAHSRGKSGSLASDEGSSADPADPFRGNVTAHSGIVTADSGP